MYWRDFFTSKDENLNMMTSISVMVLQNWYRVGVMLLLFSCWIVAESDTIEYYEYVKIWKEKDQSNLVSIAMGVFHGKWWYRLSLLRKYFETSRFMGFVFFCPSDLYTQLFVFFFIVIIFIILVAFSKLKIFVYKIRIKHVKLINTYLVLFFKFS